MEHQAITLGIVYWYCCRGPCYYIYHIPVDELTDHDIRLLSTATMNVHASWNTELFACVNKLIERKYTQQYFSNVAFGHPTYDYDTEYSGKSTYINATYRLSRTLC